MKKGLNWFILGICLFSVFTFTFLYGVEKTAQIIWVNGKGFNNTIYYYNTKTRENEYRQLSKEVYNNINEGKYYKIKLNKYFEEIK